MNQIGAIHLQEFNGHAAFRVVDGTERRDRAWRDAQDLYRILEEEIVPAYYERDAAGLPPRWLASRRSPISPGRLRRYP